MAPAGFQCVPAGSKKSVPAGPGQRDDVAVSDGGICRQKVLPYQTGLQAERGTPNNEDHRQCCVVTARNNKRGDIGVIWWHIRQRRNFVSSSRVRSQLAEFGLICKDPERLEDGACVLGLNVRQEPGNLKWGCGTAVPEVPDVFTRRAVFSLCGKLVGHLPVSGWTRAATGTIKRRASAVTKGWDNENGRSVGSHGEGDHHKGKAGWPRKRRLVCAGRRTERVGGCKLSGDWCAVGEEWSCDWGCPLVATDEWCCSHEPGRAWCGDERHQPGTPVESQEITHTPWFAMCIPLDIGHTDRQGQGEHQGGQRDADQTEVGDHKKAGDGVQSVCGCGTCHFKLQPRW